MIFPYEYASVWTLLYHPFASQFPDLKLSTANPFSSYSIAVDIFRTLSASHSCRYSVRECRFLSSVPIKMNGKNTFPNKSYLQQGNLSNDVISVSFIGVHDVCGRLMSIEPSKGLTQKHDCPIHCIGSYDPSSRHLAVIWGYFEFIIDANLLANLEHSHIFLTNLNYFDILFILLIITTVHGDFHKVFVSTLTENSIAIRIHTKASKHRESTVRKVSQYLAI